MSVTITKSIPFIGSQSYAKERDAKESKKNIYGRHRPAAVLRRRVPEKSGHGILNQLDFEQRFDLQRA